MAMGEELGALAAEKKLAPMITEAIALEEGPQALIGPSQRHARGKIAAVMDSGVQMVAHRKSAATLKKPGKWEWQWPKSDPAFHP
jgi:hypothetical protein